METSNRRLQVSNKTDATKQRADAVVEGTPHYVSWHALRKPVESTCSFIFQRFIVGLNLFDPIIGSLDPCVSCCRVFLFLRSALFCSCPRPSRQPTATDSRLLFGKSSSVMASLMLSWCCSFQALNEFDCPKERTLIWIHPH